MEDNSRINQQSIHEFISRDLEAAIVPTEASKRQRVIAATYFPFRHPPDDVQVPSDDAKIEVSIYVTNKFLRSMRF